MSEIARAIAVVSHNAPDNRQLEAANGGKIHIERLKQFLPDGQPLIDALQTKLVQDIFLNYERHDTDANIAQRRYKRCRLLLTLPLGLSLAIALLFFMVQPDAIAGWLTALSAVLGQPLSDAPILARLWPTLIIDGLLVMTPLLAVFLRPVRCYEAWMQARANAEALRVKFFEDVLAARPAQTQAASGPRLLLLKLEYFRRYQMELQQAYHETRGREHECLARRAARLQTGTLLLLGVWAVFSLSTVGAALSEQGPGWEPQALHGWSAPFTAGLLWLEIANVDYMTLAMSALLGMAAAITLGWMFMSASVRNAARYKNLRDNFKQLMTEIDQVRLKVIKLEPAKAEAEVAAFQARVHRVMSAEFADWMRLAELDLGRETVAQPTKAYVASKVSR